MTGDEYIIASQIREINAKINHDLRNEFKDSDFTIPQIIFMKILNKNIMMKINEISKEMNLANSTVSGIADRLEKQNIISRTRSDKDKRIVNIQLTDKGKEVVGEFRESINHYFEESFGKFTQEEINTILEGLDFLKKALHIKE
ncbi:MarR family winged helix-turn-helix transcriptional regulator [Haloimpatiens sp. FM7330]|uniref:MarR family winged helix-turn-helix transcriptional regulator n=1 Tax=Haloimpatiens sp. FM7330 TaxID=3298610 RepID=UPI0036443AD3